MCEISFVIFLISALVYAGIMIHDSRTLWSGFSFFWMLVLFAMFLFFTISQYSEQLASHDRIVGILIALFVVVVGCVMAFPVLLIIMFFVEGIKILRHEGVKPANLLSMLFAILLYAYLAVWPGIGNLTENTLGTVIYAIISFSVIYILALMAMYCFSAILNLIHLKKTRKADYVIVLGSGIIGTKVTPLLAARIEKGMDLLADNPNAMLIMSGGQGPGEDMPESEAMAAYAADKGVDKRRIITETKSVSTQENLMFSRRLMEKENSKIVIVTTAYHVFRALLLAKQQGIKCVGYGARTKWYFTLNALLREFVGYLRLTWKAHALVIGMVSATVIAAKLVVWLK